MNWHAIGLVLALLIALLQAFYSGWAFVDPAALASYRGTPVAHPADVPWVYAYGSRSLFVAVVVALLVIKRDLANLRWVALLGLIMPLVDGLSALCAKLPPAIIYRHLGTAMYLLITFAVLAYGTHLSRIKGIRP